MEVCPTCRDASSPSGPEAKFADVKWDEQQVYDYLTKAYGTGSVLGADVAVKVVNTGGALRVRRERRAQPGARSRWGAGDQRRGVEGGVIVPL